MPIGILIADDHVIFRHGLKALLEHEGFNVLGEAADGMEAVKLAEKLRPDVAVLDCSMPRLNGVDAAREVRRVSPRSKVIMLTNHREEQYVMEAIGAGIKGYVLKSGASTAMGDAVRAVAAGDAFLSPEVARFAVSSYVGKCAAGLAELLNPRELQVLQLIAEGHTTKEIAEQLNLTIKTAESCRMGLMATLDIHETASLVRYAVRRGLVKP